MNVQGHVAAAAAALVADCQGHGINAVFDIAVARMLIRGARAVSKIPAPVIDLSA